MPEKIQSIVPEKWLADCGSHLMNIENMVAEIYKIQSQLLQMEHNKQEYRNKKMAGTDAVRRLWR